MFCDTQTVCSVVHFLVRRIFCILAIIVRTHHIRSAKYNKYFAPARIRQLTICVHFILKLLVNMLGFFFVSLFILFMMFIRQHSSRILYLLILHQHRPNYPCAAHKIMICYASAHIFSKKHILYRKIKKQQSSPQNCMQKFV